MTNFIRSAQLTMQPSTPTNSAPQAAAAHVSEAGEEIATQLSHIGVEQLKGLFPILQARPPRVVDYRTAWRVLEAQLAAQYTRASIARALKRHTSSAAYLAALQEGAPVYDLSENVVGQVTAEQAAWAREQTPSSLSGKRARQAPPTLKILSERFPALFNLQEPRPLPPGTYKLLLKQLGGIYTPSDLAAAVRFYCHVLRQAHSQKPEVVAARRDEGASAFAAAPGGKRELSFQELKARYSACFDATPPRPLAQSVMPTLERELGREFSRRSVRSVLRTHTLSRTYLQVLVDGALRYNLAGEVEGAVSEAEAQEALSLLADPLYAATFVLRMRAGLPLAPQAREELLAALEASDLSGEEFAQRYKVPTDALIAQRSFALRERKLERRAQRKLVEDYVSSGLSEQMYCTKRAVKLRVLRKAIETIEAEDITAALAASVAAQNHEPLKLHDSIENAASRHQPQGAPPSVTVRRRRRIAGPDVEQWC